MQFTYTPAPSMGDDDQTTVSTRTSRRSFLQTLSILSGAFIVALGSIPVLGTLLSPLTRKKKEDNGFLFAIELQRLQVGVPKRVELVASVVDGWTRSTGVVGAAWLLKHTDETGEKVTVTALSTVCPHSGCSINMGRNTNFVCPCHDSSFDFSGRPLHGPAPRTLDPLQVRIRDEKVFVRYARFKQGIKERQEL